ncbi:MAG: hypothetical protein COV67_08515 [Nitrospinae bacterium CG11_big_fil_rev_8_21_14_0_20_56_8]|nr:MAG: hypothetical protein COV67_08515 [Nitrospinae bacterium CG11_big_fil_rev_8_21_14_0_20_56_8]
MNESALTTISEYIAPNNTGENQETVKEIDNGSLITGGGKVQKEDYWDISTSEDSFSNETSELSTKVEKIFNDFWGKGIDLFEREGISEYFWTFPGLISIIPKVCNQIQYEFNFEAGILLKICEDREDPEDKFLKICVRYKKYDRDFLGKIKKVSATFQPYRNVETGWFLITTDFGS